jgi:PAS domain S-box-containing protein
MQFEQKVNVLLVDDHPENLLALEAILDSPSQHLVKAHSGEEALRCLLHQDFAVILLDVQMPGMDGFETATLIRNRPRSQYTPIIFLTAFSTSDTLMFKGYSLGAVDYLFKPVEPEILTSKVAVFVDLFKKTAEIKRQAVELAAVNAELRQSEERFRSLSACSPVGIFLTDVEGHCTYTNPRFQTICGITFEQSLGDNWLQSVHPEDRERVLADWPASRLANREYSDEFRVETPEGIVRQVHVRASPMLSAQGELLGHVGTVEDITNRKQAEEARAQVIREQVARQQAETANRMKDEFLATLSHELRTPLNSVLGWARLLRTRSFDATTTARALETIERNAKSQAQMIEDILDVSRIIRGKLNLNLRPINLIPVIEAAIDSVRPAAEAKSIQVEYVLDPSVNRVTDDGFPFSSRGVPREASSSNGSLSPPNLPWVKEGTLAGSIVVNGDPDRVQQMVWNLLTNAIKFTPEEGRIEVRSLLTGSHAQIQVSDTGIGISPEFLPHVFDRFRQADSTTTRTHGGLGLGLAIVHHLVELHGGRVYAESEGEGQGATFTIELPLQNSVELQPSSLEQPELRPESDQPLLSRSSDQSLLSSSEEALRTLSGLQVLIVDDEPDVRELLATVIEESGAEAIAVESSLEALKVLEQLQPDVLISDIAMSCEDGYSLIRKVRNREAEQGGCLPAVALTAYVREEDSKQAIESGFQMHLSKPIDTTELVMAVANLAGRALTFSE